MKTLHDMNPTAIALCTAPFPPSIVAGCSTAPKTDGARTVQAADVDAFLVRVKKQDPSLKKLFNDCEACAAFPDLGEGGQFALSAQASAAAVKAGAAATADDEGGVAVFVVNPVGLMLEASVGGQQFCYRAAADVD